MSGNDQNRMQDLKELLAETAEDVSKSLKPYEWAALFGSAVSALLFLASGWLWIRQGEEKWSGLCQACLFFAVAGLALLHWRTERLKGVLWTICAVGIFAVLLYFN